MEQEKKAPEINTSDKRFKIFCEQFEKYDAPSKTDILAVCFDLAETLLRKNCDYGDSALKKPTIADVTLLDSILVRKEDKIRRISNLCRKRSEVSDETLIDTLLDDAGYDILTIIAVNRSGILKTISDIAQDAKAKK